MAIAGDQHAVAAPDHRGHARIARALRFDHAGEAARVGRLAAMALDEVPLERSLYRRRRGRQPGTRRFGDDGARLAAREVGGGDRPAMLQRELHQRPVERPVPALAVEATCIGYRFDAGLPRGIDCRLVLAVELLHGQDARRRSQRVEDCALLAMMLGIVVRLAEDDVLRARGTLVQRLRRNEPRGARVPDPALERQRVRARSEQQRRQNDQGRFGC